MTKKEIKEEHTKVQEIIFDNVSKNVCKSLAESRGSSPTQLAKTIGISPKIIVTKIKELDSHGFIKKDDNEIKQFGEEWAFYALTNDGYRLYNNLRHFDL
jgi:DNA-binding HxlR family transcriptional regulator